MDLPAMFDLTDRVAIVTGGSRGIGRAIVDGFSAAGATVVVASRKAAACDAVAAEVVAAGGRALSVPTHLGDLEAVRRLVDITAERLGRLDIVVNNAATALAQPLEHLTEEAWAKSYAVNLQGPVVLAQHALPHLRRSPHAVILNVLSVGAITYSPSTAMYSAAKAAMLSYTRNMAAEWAADGIRVNALAPGAVDTDMVRNNPPELVEHMRTINLQQRLGAPEEMVGPALFLVSDAASYVTGQLLVADGGYAVAR